jgi:predicted DCC family thiol-disulfide oxidoreductase YuxK
VTADVPAYPLTLYYDASCPLCLAEMTALARSDARGRLRLVDCSQPGFVDADCIAGGHSTTELMQRMHARDADGRWWVGIPAFAVAYAAIGVEGVSRFFADPRWRPVLDRLYAWVADHRQGLSRLGLNGVFGAWVHRRARRAAQRTHACADDACRLDEHRQTGAATPSSRGASAADLAPRGSADT